MGWGRAIYNGADSAGGGTTVKSGTLLVSGAINHPGGDLIIGDTGGDNAAFGISGNKTVNDLDAILGNSTGASGTAGITGGTWNSAGGMFVGNSGSGALTILSTALVKVNSGTGTVTLASGTGSAGTLNIGGGTLNAATVTGGSGTAVVNFTNSGTITFAPQLAGSLSVNQTGVGTTILTGSHAYTGSTAVGQGTLQVNGSIATSSGVSVSTGATLAGSGVVSNISGAGSVTPGGNAILTASQVDPSGGLGFDFHFSQTGAPNYGSATASGNDLLHLTGATPFTIALGSGNIITLDFTGLSLQPGQTFYGGIFADSALADSMLNGATFNYTGLNGVTMQYDGLAPVAEADFTSGTVTNGEVMKFEVAQPVPAASAWALAITGAGLFVAARRFVSRV